MTDAGGAVALAREYDLWGIPLQGGGSSGYAYTGREWDAETGLYYYRARYYDPKIGRFISEDPEGLPEGPNLYAYVANRPTRFRDPSGRHKTDTPDGDYAYHSWCDLGHIHPLGTAFFIPCFPDTSGWFDWAKCHVVCRTVTVGAAGAAALTPAGKIIAKIPVVAEWCSVQVICYLICGENPTTSGPE